MAAAKLIAMMFQKVPIFQRQSICSLREHYLYQTFQISASYSNSASGQGEAELKKLLKEKFPLAKEIEVNDISGGCGAMYQITVSTIEFRGLSLLQQHSLVNEALSEKIKDMHGITINTEIP